MTLVVGLVHKGCVYMGSDSAEAFRDELTLRCDPQVFCNGPFLLAVPGSIRVGNLLRYVLEIPDPASDGDLQRYIVTEFLTAVRDCFTLGGFTRKDRDTGQELGGQFLVGYRGHLFSIASDFRVVEPMDGYAALGTGFDVALGALYATEEQNPKYRVRAALSAAERLNGAVRPPFHVLCPDANNECTECQDARSHLRAL